MPFTSNILFDDAEERDRKDQQQDDQGLNQFGAGFSAGIKQTQGLLGGGLPALIQSAIGDEDDAFEYLQYYNQKMQEASDLGGDFQRVEDIDGAEDAVQWLTYTLGQALPSIGTSIIGGGLGGAAVQYGAKKFIAESVEAQVKKKAGDAFEKAMVKRELNRRTAKARRLGQGAGAFVASAGMNAGETFANVYEESGGISDPALALGTGIAAGALDALAPLSILKKILPDNMAEPFKEAMADRLLRNKGVVQRAFIEGVRTGGIEGATEAAQEVLQATAVGMFNDPEGGYKSYGESFFDALNNPTEQQSSQYLNAFAAGLVGGGGMGGVSGAMYKPRSAPEVQEEEPQQSPMPDSEGNMPVDTPQSEELEAQQAGFDSYADYLDAYETGPARMNRGVSLEAIQNIIPDEYYLGQDISEEDNARLEAETLQLRDEFNPSLNDLVGQVVGQDDSEGVLRRREDGVFVYSDFKTGEEVAIESGEANQDKPAEVSGLEQRDSSVELEGGSGVTFNSDDSTFTARRGKFRYFSTNYDEDGEVATVTAETMDGEPRTFGKKMAKAIEDAKAGVEMQQMRSDLANQVVQADDLPEDLQVALVQADVLEETLQVDQVEEIIQTMPEARQEPLRKRIESLMTREGMEEAPIAASTFERSDETNIFNGVITRSGSVTLEERQSNLNATAGQEVQQPNGDDPIVIPSTGLEGIAEKVATAMRNQFKVRNRDGSTSFYTPANKHLGEANQDIGEEIQQAVFDLVESGMAPEAIGGLEQISVHTDNDFNGADGVALSGGVSLRDAIVDGARTDEGASALRFILAHEMHHVFDLSNSISEQLPSFEVEISFSGEGANMSAGDVVMELYENYVNRTEVGRLFAYPFNMLDEDTQDLNADFDVLANTMRQEVFAQLGAVYVSDPRLLKSQAPEAYQVIRTIRGADNATNQDTEAPVQPQGTGVQGEVRPSTVSGSAEVEDGGGTGVAGGDGVEAGPTSEVVGGETQQPDGDSDGRVVRPEDLTIKRADNFSTNGEYNVTFPDGSVTQIFRDTLQFSTPRWIWVESEPTSPEYIFGIGDNRNEAVQRLIQLMGYDLPPQDNVLLKRGPTGRPYQGLPANETLGGEDRVQTSLPNGMRQGEKFYETGAPENYSIGIDRILSDSAKTPVKEKLKTTIEGYNFFTPSRPDLTAEETIEEFKSHMVDNLIWLHDQMDPEVRAEAKRWYDGARKQTDIWVARYGYEPRQVAAVVANLSPQKDWFMNMSLAERMMDVYKYRQDFTADKSMNDAFIRVVLSDEKGKRRLNLNKQQEAQKKIWSQIKDKTLSEVSSVLPEAQVDLGEAIWVRMHDEAKHSRNFRVMRPSGDIMGLSMGQKGPKNVAWGSFTEIAKGISVLRDGSLENVSLSLGDAHKVRNFYNNIIAPDSELGEVTIDTHAVAAALFKPLSAKSYEVAHAFGGTPSAQATPQQLGLPDGVSRSGAGSSRVIGVGGTYGVVADAYREAAERLDILPRQLQSITWEEVRVIYPASFKDEKGVNLGKINDLWTRYGKGELSINEVRDQAYEITGTKGSKPVWTDRSSVEGDGESGTSTYARELYPDGVSGSGSTGSNVGSGSDVDATAGATAGGLAATVKVGKPNTKVRPSVQRAYAALQAGQITRQEYDEAVLETIRPYEAVPTPATQEEMLNALAGRQKERINQPIEEGAPVGLRLDINAYENKGTWVPTVHRNGSSPVHQATASITGADFTLFKQEKSKKVMEGLSKSPFAQIKGAYVNRSDEDNVKLAQQYLNDPEWRQIGFDPRRHATFYDRVTGEPIARADEVIQVGPLVLAKNAETLEVDQVLFKRGQKNSHAEASATGELTNGQLSSNEFALDDETRGELFLRKIQDKYFSLKKFEDAAAEFLGLKELPEHMQTYVPETLHSGKIKTDFDELETSYVAPLAKILRDNDIDPDDFGLYLMAKHAPERNRRVATLYQEQDEVGPLPDFVGAGMSTEDANRVVSELENPSFLRAAEIVYDMLTKNRERMVEAGLINEDTSDSWNSNYQFYVPLKGFATTEDESGKLVAPKGLPKGFSVSGKESFKALGRTSQAENPVLFALADSEEKIVRGRRNEVGQQFLSLADAIQEQGSEQLKTYRSEDVYPTVRAKNSKGKYINKQMRADEMRTATRLDTGDKRFLSVKVDGEEIFIEIENAGLNRAMHNVGAENFAGLTGFLGSSTDFMQKFQNFRRNMLINWNPSWFLINPLRDIQTGLMYNLAQESKEGGMVEGEKLTGEILRRYLPAYKSYYKNLRGNKADNEYDAYFTEYQESGAPTGLTLTKDIEEQRARLNALLTDGALVAKGKQGLQEIEYLNQASENAVRFSAYVSARESGVSVQKAANLAKNLTVNFNRKGELSSGLNLFYLFFNAAVQGTANIAQAMSGKTADGKLTKAQVGAASIALVAYMVTQHNLGAADEDEDGESVYNDLSDYDHLMSWNMVLNDGKTFAQIPMPYGYGFFHTLGRLGAEYMNDTKDEGDVAAEMTASFAHHMLPPPLGFVGSVGTVDDLDEFGKRMLGNIAPSILEPAVQYATNTNHFGSPLYLEGNPLIRPSAPDSSRAKRSTSKVYQDIAEWMNDATGGSLYRSGAVDVSPDGMQYLQEYLLGGLGRFVNRSADLAAKYNSPEDEEISASDIPIVRYFFGEPSEYSDKMDYYGYISSATQVFKEASESTGQERVRFQQEFRQVISLEPLYKEGQKKLRKLRQRKKQIEKTQNDPVKAYDQIQKIEAEMQKVYDSFNKRYREATR